MRKLVFALVCILFINIEIAFPAQYKATLTHVWGGTPSQSPSYYGDNSGWNMVEYSTSSLQDGSLLTGLDIAGRKCVSEWREYNIGAFIVLEFQTSLEANKIYLDIHARSYGDINNWVCMSADTSFSDNYLDYGSDILSIKGFFDKNGNNILNIFPNINKQWQTIDNIRLPNNCFQFLLWGPYLESHYVNTPLGLEVFEAYATYEPIPEPASLLLLGLGGMLIRKR